MDLALAVLIAVVYTTAIAALVAFMRNASRPAPEPPRVDRVDNVVDLAAWSECGRNPNGLFMEQEIRR